MSQTQTKVFHGPYTVSFNATTGVAKKSYSGSNKDSVTVDITTKVVTEELVDGAEIYDEAGRQLTMEITLDEVVAADLDLIEEINAGATPEVTIQFTNMPAATDTLTVAEQGIKAFVDMSGLKPVVKVKVGVPAGTTFATLFGID